MASRASTPAAKRRASRSASGRVQRSRAATSSAPAKSRTSTRRAPARTAKRPAARNSSKRPAARSRRPAAGRRGAARRPSLRLGLIVALLGAGALAAGYFGWLRDSSLVAVRDVSVSGVSSPDAGRIEAALTKAATGMTTLHVREDELEDAVAGFPTVVSVDADAKLLHGLEIAVSERPPVLMAEPSGGSPVPVAGDGTLLRGLELGKQAKALPVVSLKTLPGSGRLAGEPLEQAKVLGATPGPLRAQIESVDFVKDGGVEVKMSGGIPILFGPGAQASEKWAAAAAVLADPKLKTLTYLDVRVPERPAVGGAAAPTAAEPAPVPAEPGL